MKNIYVLITFLFLIIQVQLFCFDDQIKRAMTWSNLVDIEQQKEMLLNAANQTKKIIGNAAYAMIDAQSSFLSKKISASKFDEIVYQQSSIIAHEEQNLKQFIDRTIPGLGEKAFAQEGYLSQFKKSLMAWYGYEITDEQKATRQLIDELLRQKDILTDEYDLVKLDDELTVEQKNVLKKRYDNVIKKIDTNIYQQQVTIGDKWSLLKKAIMVVGAAAATTVAGLLFTNRMWVTENK